MEASEIAELFKDSVERRLSKGESVWRAGDDPESVWMVKEGRANMVIESSDGAASTVHFCTKAQVFCPAAAISGRPYPCAATAATDMTLVSAPRSSFMAVLNRMPEFAQELLVQLAGQVCEAHCQKAMSSAPVKNRLASLLGTLNRRYAGHDLPFTRQELANMSDTTVESAIRTLSQWEKNGVIESARGSIHVRRPRTLEEAVG
ncbi:MAG TPA: Crp/Fnr family transcriptional regulator [bacterium]|nr:Crp/Fnr family transcriptional regulator [bacterium]